MAVEQMIFDIITRARTEGLDRTSRAASQAAGNVDTLTRRLEEVGNKSATARVTLAGNKEAQAALDRLDAKLVSLDRRVGPDLKVEGAARAIAEISALDLELDKIGGKSGKGGSAGAAAAGLSGLSGMGGMGALIGAGVALSPVLLTLGFGLTGLAIGAAGTVAPLLKAAKAAGGLQANLHKLDPEQQAAARSLLSLQGDYRKFEAALKPVVLKDFGIAVGVASHLLDDLRPVAQSTGTALGGLLHQVDAEFQSKQWQQFFSWMAAQAGPDIRQVGNLIVDLTKDIPQLMQELQPLAHGFLVLADDIVKAADAYIRFIHAEEHKANQQGTIFTQIKDWLKYGYGDSYKKQVLAAASAQKALALRLMDAHTATADLIHPVGTFTGGLQAAKVAAQQEAGAVNALVASLTAMSGGLLTAEQDQVAWKQAQQAATQAINANSHSLNSNKASALAARAAIINSTQAALAFAQQETKQSGNTRAASQTIRDQIRYLQDHAGKSKIAKQEIDLLRQALQKLGKVPPIHESIYMTGHGKWGIFGRNPVNSGLFNAAASGWRVPGYGGGDRWPVLAEGGETIVPKHLTPAVAPLMKAHGVPGFASGGIVGDYAGNAAGLRPWTARNWDASMRVISNDMAAGIQRAVAAALASAVSSGFGAAGPGGGAPAANAALARRMMPAWGSGAEWAAWNYLEMREAGWNQYARNPSSGAYGIPQALPPTKMPFAAQAAGGSNPRAQIGWMIGYIRSVYGDPISAAGHERAFSWYDRGGWLPPGPSLAWNGTGRPEQVIAGSGPGSMAEVAALLRQVVRLLDAAPARTAAGVSGALGVAAGHAIQSARYG